MNTPNFIRQIPLIAWKPRMQNYVCVYIKNSGGERNYDEFWLR
jgi:hypothetical protein